MVTQAIDADLVVPHEIEARSTSSLVRPGSAQNRDLMLEKEVIEVHGSSPILRERVGLSAAWCMFMQAMFIR